MNATGNPAADGKSQVVTLANEGGIAVVTVNSPPVNGLSAAVRGGLKQAFETAAADPAVEAVVLICEGQTFMAGADISEFGKPPVSPSFREVQDVMEATGKPVVMAIHGTALGGGLEIALVGHYRIAVPSAKLGLPEVKLGLLPGAGGTQRLPRVVGVEKALALITSGDQVPAKEALKIGLLDALAEEGQLKRDALAFARAVLAEKRPLKRVGDLDDKLAEVRGKPEVFAEFRKANARRFRGFEAPEAIIRCVEAAVDLPLEEGLVFERARFEELKVGSQSAAQRHYFFAERQAAKVPDVPADTPQREILTVGVLGAGTMGSGIAMSFLNGGFRVRLLETSEAALERGAGTIRKTYEGNVERGRMSQADFDGRLAQLAPTLDYADLADCDLIVEAVFEQMDIKKQVFAKLDAVAKPGAILATNTSYLDVNEIAAATKRPQDVIGLHFFSPAHIMRLLEVVRGSATAKDVIATSMKLARRIGKVPVLVGVCHGFVGNRIHLQRQTQAERIVLEGATPWQVDKVLEGFGLPMGPFRMRDMAGNDVGWNREASSSATVREILNEMGRHGQKSGAGYYNYDADRKPTPSDVSLKVIRDFAAARGIPQREISDEEIFERCLYVMVNEGAKILEEGVASRASDIDVVWVTGYGWPVYRGGPMFWGELVGLEKISARLSELAAAHGDSFKPAALLQRLAAEGKGFAAA